MSNENVIRCELKGNESRTVLDMVQDCIDRGMIASDYETDAIESFLEQVTDGFDSYKKDLDFEITITAKKKQ